MLMNYKSLKSSKDSNESNESNECNESNESNECNESDTININQVYKYKNIDINKINISLNNINYNNNIFYIQSPIFLDYELQNINSKKYIELKLENYNSSHVKFLTFIDSIELILNNFIKDINIKTQIITNIQNQKSLKAKILENTVYFDINKNKINNLYTNKISLLLKLEYFSTYYSWNVIQILQLN